MSETNGGATYVLQYPIAGKTRTITEISLRRPLVGDIRAMDAKGGNDTTKMLTLLQRIAALAPDEVDAMDVADLEGVSQIVSGFMPRAPQ